MDILQQVAERLRAEFAPDAVSAQLTSFLVNALTALVTLTVFIVVWLALRAFLRRVFARSRLDETAQGFALTVLRYFVLLIGIVAALSAFGVNTASLVTSVGVLGLTIGFAARDALSNIISGIFIFWDRPFVIGDLIEVGDHYGRVDRITMRSTRVITSDGKMLAIPNNEMVNSTVASYTNFPNLRLDVGVTVAVDTNLGQARRVLIDLVAHDAEFLKEPPPRVVVTALNDYNVALELQAWLRNERDHIKKRFALREAMFEALSAAGIEMPFETLELQPIEVRGERAP